LRTDENCDAVIALTHLGGSQPGGEGNPITGEAANLADVCPDFDAIICGHTHTLISGFVNGIPIVQGNYNGRGMARLTLVFNDDQLEITPKYYTQNDMNTDAILPSNPLEVNEEMKGIIQGYADAVGPLFSEVVGTFGEAIADRAAMAQWATDVVWDYIKAETDEDYILIQNAGGWRDVAPYPKAATDNVDLGFLYTLMPFDNEIVLLKMRGKDIKYMFGSPTPSLISAPVVAGATKTGDDWYYNGALIDDDTVYPVACNDLMVTGGDNFPFPGSGPGNAKTPPVEVIEDHSFMGVPLRDAMIEVLKDRAGISAATPQESYIDFMLIKLCLANNNVLLKG
jgi:2',3'-cyclic-nucleotide 2'-phosphodiesterase (5'-nucleotidase family)